MVDLIPDDYRRLRRLQRLLGRFAAACAAVLALAAAGRVALGFALDTERVQRAAVEARRSQAASVRARATELEQQRHEAAQTLAALDRLRGGAPAEALFPALDDALDRRVWFQELALAREPEPAGGQPRERIDVRGHALDHAALSDFVQRLRARPGIAQIRLHDVGTRSYTSLQVVDFHLEIALGAGGGAGR